MSMGTITFTKNEKIKRYALVKKWPCGFHRLQWDRAIGPIKHDTGQICPTVVVT